MKDAPWRRLVRRWLCSLGRHRRCVVRENEHRLWVQCVDCGADGLAVRTRSELRDELEQEARGFRSR